MIVFATPLGLFFFRTRVEVDRLFASVPEVGTFPGDGGWQNGLYGLIYWFNFGFGVREGMLVLT